MENISSRRNGDDDDNDDDDGDMARMLNIHDVLFASASSLDISLSVSCTINTTTSH